MKRLIIADAHLGQRRGDVAEMNRMIGLASEAGLEEVIYLGDAFQYLIGMSKLWTGSVRSVLDAWQVYRRNGARLVLVEGNRDFFLDEPELARLIDWSGRRYELQAGGRRFRLVHGDLVNQRDRQYRFWAAVSKNRVSRLWARLLPRPIAVAIVRRMEARLAKTNTRYRYKKPVDALVAEAGQAFREGIDVMLWGHFHTGWSLVHDRRLAMVIPAWLETTISLLIDEDGSCRYVDSTLTPVDEVSTILP
jgi:UDP-2,3-diacylglucosamine hydrolase